MLDYIISSEGIKTNPKKTKAITLMTEPQNKNRSAKADRKNSSLKQVDIQVSRMQSTFLQGSKR